MLKSPIIFLFRFMWNIHAVCHLYANLCSVYFCLNQKFYFYIVFLIKINEPSAIFLHVLISRILFNLLTFKFGFEHQLYLFKSSLFLFFPCSYLKNPYLHIYLLFIVDSINFLLAIDILVHLLFISINLSSLLLIAIFFVLKFTIFFLSTPLIPKNSRLILYFKCSL